MRLAPWFSLVRFSHSVFALPFALMAAWLAAGGMPALPVLGLIVLCAVAARTAAMGFNRLVDRRIDGLNPRTAGRELPAGTLRPAGVALLVLLSSAVFVAGAFALNPLAGRLSFAVLAVLLGYSFVKRFSWLAHAVLGLCLGLAPLGAWLAVTGDLEGDLWLPPVPGGRRAVLGGGLRPHLLLPGRRVRPPPRPELDPGPLRRSRRPRDGARPPPVHRAAPWLRRAPGRAGLGLLGWPWAWPLRSWSGSMRWCLPTTSRGSTWPSSR